MKFTKLTFEIITLAFLANFALGNFASAQAAGQYKVTKQKFLDAQKSKEACQTFSNLMFNFSSGELKATWVSVKDAIDAGATGVSGLPSEGVRNIPLIGGIAMLRSNPTIVDLPNVTEEDIYDLRGSSILGCHIIYSTYADGIAGVQKRDAD